MRIRLAALIAASAVGLTACEQRVDGSSAAAYSASLKAISDKLPAAKRAELQQALVAIAANTGEPSEAMVSGAEPGSLIMLAAEDKLKGKTADEIIKLGYQTEVTNLGEDIAKDAAETQRLRAEQEKYAGVFNNIHIDGAKYHVKKEMFENQPILSMLVTNNSNMVIKTIYIHGTLTSPGRSIPWIDQDFNTDFTGGLEPGESKALNLAPNPFSEWRADDEFSYRPDLKFNVTLINIDNAAGQKLITADLSDAASKQADMMKKQQELKIAQDRLAKL